mmetsp:Transcript_79668/g.234360  ORF Transcript_79668/g.234360 Transcript_79668/m.234360 type:complete len:412 (-) Transcript_79668:202-1437(-)
MFRRAGRVNGLQAGGVAPQTEAAQEVDDHTAVAVRGVHDADRRVLAGWCAGGRWVALAKADGNAWPHTVCHLVASDAALARAQGQLHPGLVLALGEGEADGEAAALAVDHHAHAVCRHPLALQQPGSSLAVRPHHVAHLQGRVRRARVGGRRQGPHVAPPLAAVRAEDVHGEGVEGVADHAALLLLAALGPKAALEPLYPASGAGQALGLGEEPQTGLGHPEAPPAREVDRRREALHGPHAAHVARQDARWQARALGRIRGQRHEAAWENAGEVPLQPGRRRPLLIQVPSELSKFNQLPRTGLAQPLELCLHLRKLLAVLLCFLRPLLLQLLQLRVQPLSLQPELLIQLLVHRAVLCITGGDTHAAHLLQVWFQMLGVVLPHVREVHSVEEPAGLDLRSLLKLGVPDPRLV